MPYSITYPIQTELSTSSGSPEFKAIVDEDVVWWNTITKHMVDTKQWLTDEHGRLVISK